MKKKPQFKIGDKVIIRDNEKYDPCELASGYVESMTQFAGQEATIKTVGMDARGLIEYRLEGVGFWWDERLLRPVGERVIVVYRKGNDVIALNKLTGEKGVAHCSPKDEFDFDVGAKIAFGRLFHYEERPEPKMQEEEGKPHVFYARCIEAKSLGHMAVTEAGAFFTAGKVYKVVDGMITDEGGYTWGYKGSFHDASELSSYWTVGPYTARFCDVTEREYKA